MKKLICSLLLIFLASMMFGCNSRGDKIPTGSTTNLKAENNEQILLKKHTIPNTQEWAQDNRYEYSTIYACGLDTPSLFYFELYYKGDSSVPTKTTLYYFSNNKKRKIKEFAGENAQITYAATNNQGLIWSISNETTYLWSYDDKEIIPLNIKATNFTLSDKYMLLNDPDTNMLTSVNIVNNSQIQYTNELINPYWFPNIYQNKFYYTIVNNKTLDIHSVDLNSKENDIILKLDINKNKLSNLVLSTIANEKFCVLSCLHSKSDYVNFLNYVVNRENGEVKEININASDIAFVSENKFIYLNNGQCFLYNIAEQKSSLVEDLKEDSFYLLAQYKNEVILYSNDNISVAVIN